MRWPYRLFPVGQAVLPLGGRWVRPRPVLSVTLIGPAGLSVQEGLLDTGADDTVFPEALAAKLGLDLSRAPVGSASGIGMRAVLLRYAEVAFRLTDGREQREWQAWVGFTRTPLRRGLLGFAGFLQFFTATFHGDREQVELTINRLYRGT